MSRAKRAASVLRLKLEGPGFRGGAITVPDLVTVCQQVQNAVNRQAEALEGKQTLRRGSKTAKVHQECTLEVIGLGKGSTVLKFALAKVKSRRPTIAPGRHEIQ